MLMFLQSVNPLTFVLVGGLLPVFIVIIGLIVSVCRFPFSHASFYYAFDVTGKRQPEMLDCLDRFLIDGGFTQIQDWEAGLGSWKLVCEDQIAHSLFKKLRRRQFEEAWLGANGYCFQFVRYQTRYRQKNYVKYSYKVPVYSDSTRFSFEQIAERYEKLRAINFACTLQEYHSQDQRKLATRAFREQVMKRDDYICQICGKYMPDEVGLQVDHIIPVSKGGKTVLSNMQVLCSKCNGKKSNKVG